MSKTISKIEALLDAQFSAKHDIAPLKLNTDAITARTADESASDCTCSSCCGSNFSRSGGCTCSSSCGSNFSY